MKTTLRLLAALALPAALSFGGVALADPMAADHPMSASPMAADHPMAAPMAAPMATPMAADAMAAPAKPMKKHHKKTPAKPDAMAPSSTSGAAMSTGAMAGH
jgi:hypothetical protein